jgi:hypothetical protein
MLWTTLPAHELYLFLNLAGSCIYGCLSLQGLLEANLQVLKLDGNPLRR